MSPVVVTMPRVFPDWAASYPVGLQRLSALQLSSTVPFLPSVRIPATAPTPRPAAPMPPSTHPAVRFDDFAGRGISVVPSRAPGRTSAEVFAPSATTTSVLDGW